MFSSEILLKKANIKKWGINKWKNDWFDTLLKRRFRKKLTLPKEIL